MAEPFIGQIITTGFNFAPRGYATCDGQLLSIAQNTALFSLLGTQFGGDGRVTFGLPDLRGRVPVHQGQGPGLTPRTMGEMAGEENHTLISTEMPLDPPTTRSVLPPLKLPVAMLFGDPRPAGAVVPTVNVNAAPKVGKAAPLVLARIVIVELVLGAVVFATARSVPARPLNSPWTIATGPLPAA